MTVEESLGVVRARPPSRKRRLRHALRRGARHLVDWIGPTFLRALSSTWRMTILGAENLEATVGGHRGHFVALWHGRMLLGLPHHGAREWYVLVSGSQDGDISEALLGRFGYRVIRGSTSRGGARAVRQMLEVLDSGAVMIITPDGPRGPRHSMNPGLAWLARATGYPVVPIGFACSRAWRARSWDRFTVPLPWSRIVMTYDRPIAVGRDGGDAELESATRSIREGLLRAEQRGFDLLEQEPDW